MNAKQSKKDKICERYFKVVLFACSRVSRAIAIYSSELRQQPRKQMFTTETGQIRKC